MLKLFFTFIITLFTIGTYSQSSNGNHVSSTDTKLITNSFISERLLKSKFKVSETYKDVQGSPYVENFSGVRNNIPLGKLYDVNMKLIGTAFILYNAYTDEMEISAIEDSVDFYLLKKESKSFYIKLQQKLYRAYVSDYKIGYFVIVSENDNEKISLLKKEKIMYIKGSQQNVSLVKGEPSSFRKINDSFYIKIDDLVYKIPNKKKNFFALFKEKADSIKAYVKENKLKTSSEKDLLTIFNHYNSILSKG